MKNKTLIILTACTSIISCNNEVAVVETPNKEPTETINIPKYNPSAPNPSIYLKDNVWVSSGINYKTGEPVVINSLTGETVTPCTPELASTKEDDSSSTPITPEISSAVRAIAQPQLATAKVTPLNTPAKIAIPKDISPVSPKAEIEQDTSIPCEISILNKDPDLNALLKASQSITHTKIKRGDKWVEARVVVEVSLLYEGSFCTTKYIGGDQYSEVCFNKTSHCESFKGFIEPFLRAYYSHLPENEIKGIITEVKNGKIDGINVTVPFKKSVIPFIDELSSEAKEAQSVNTIYKENNKVLGHNTDISGFELAIRGKGYNIKDKKVFILGAGGVVAPLVSAALPSRELL